MILSYSRTSFVPAIIQNTKKHTLLKTDRWKAGMVIHHWLGNPRNTKSTPPPFCFHEGECHGTERVLIERDMSVPLGFFISVMPGNRLSEFATLNLCRNDGLNAYEFREWFLPPGTDEWRGNIIHFTPLRYAT